MHRLFVPTWGPSDWRRLLANPSTQWVKGKSALELAVAWEAARRDKRGLPADVAALLDTHHLTREASLLMGLPELQVELPGGGHQSQTDLWALLRTPSQLISLAVEAKSGEAFDRPVQEWLKDAGPTSGKPARLAALREDLGLADAELAGIRYQLLHRAAAAVRMADRFRASVAVLLIQAFGGDNDRESRSDFQSFTRLMSCDAPAEGLMRVGRPTCLPLLVGWVESRPADQRILADAI